jgi:hypothetical protein
MIKVSARERKENSHQPERTSKMTGYASEKQIDYILVLASKINGSAINYLDQLSEIGIYLTRKQKQGKITKSEASMLIDDLKSQLDK